MVGRRKWLEQWIQARACPSVRASRPQQDVGGDKDTSSKERAKKTKANICIY